MGGKGKEERMKGERDGERGEGKERGKEGKSVSQRRLDEPGIVNFEEN